MSTPVIILLSTWALFMLYMFAWVGPRIFQLSRLSKRVINIVFAEGSDWSKKQHLCDKLNEINPQYGFKPIKLESFYTKEEIELLKS